jgi:succinoglycan biosynthesis protein ExoA
MSRGVVPLGIVIPVRNEATALPKLLQSLASQQATGSICCLALVDGQSEDDSRAIIASWQSRIPALQLIENPERITPVAFNLGIEASMEAGAEAVLLIGAHSWLAADFLQQLQEALRTLESPILGAVHDYPPATSRFQRAMQAFSESRMGRRLVAFSQLKKATETDVAFCPTIRRQVFDRIGLFDERMVRNQDNDFTTRARAAGFQIVTDPHLRYTYVPRGSFPQLLRQMRGNGLWVGRRPASHGLRHLAPALFWSGLIASSLVSLLSGGPWGWLVAVWGIPYLLVVAGAALAWARRIGSAALWLPVMFTAGHAAYALGTYVGLLTSKSARRSGAGGSPVTRHRLPRHQRAREPLGQAVGSRLRGDR